MTLPTSPALVEMIQNTLGNKESHPAVSAWQSGWIFTTGSFHGAPGLHWVDERFLLVLEWVLVFCGLWVYSELVRNKKHPYEFFYTWVNLQ